MRRTWVLVCAALAVGTLIVSLLAGVGTAGERARPDLAVTGGSVHASGGKLKGTFVVRNKGDARAPRSSAWLIVRAGGKNRVAEPFRVRRLGESVTETFAVSAPIPGNLPAGLLPIQACADGPGAVHKVTDCPKGPASINWTTRPAMSLSDRVNPSVGREVSGAGLEVAGAVSVTPLASPTAPVSGSRCPAT